MSDNYDGPAMARTILRRDAEIKRLRQRIADAELALRFYDEGGTSEYWLRHPARAAQLTESEEWAKAHN